MAKSEQLTTGINKKHLFSAINAFSLVELMVTLLLIGIVAAAVGALFLNTQKFYKHSNSRMNARQESSRVLRVLQKELRQISQSSEDLEAMELADKNQLTFFADIDNDSKPEKVNYRLNGSSIIKTVTQASGQAAPWQFDGAQSQETLTANSNNNVNMPLFKYYEAMDQELTQVPLNKANRGKVKIVKITVSVLLPDGLKADKFETEIYLRNKNEPL